MCATKDELVLEVFNPFVTMTNGEDVISRYDQVAVHQAGQSSNYDVTGI